MTISGIGTDIIEIKRIKTIVLHRGDKFVRKILTYNEWFQYKKKNKKIHFLAKHFAVKEAAFKAFGTGIRNGLSFTQIEVFNNTLGKPSLKLFSKADIIAKKLGITGIYVTLSDEKYYAYATVIFEI